MSYISELRTCRSLDDVLKKCLGTVVNINLRSILIRGAAGVEEDPAVQLRESKNVFIDSIAKNVLEIENDSYLFSDIRLDSLNSKLLASINDQSKRYVLIKKLYRRVCRLAN